MIVDVFSLSFFGFSPKAEQNFPFQLKFNVCGALGRCIFRKFRVFDEEFCGILILLLHAHKFLLFFVYFRCWGRTVSLHAHAMLGSCFT